MPSVLDDIKTLLEILDNTKNDLLNLYIRKAKLVVKKYLNNNTFDDVYIETNFPDAIIELVVNAYNIKKNTKDGIKQEQQGSRNKVYKDDTQTFVLNETIKNLLPIPYAKLR
ncbi:MAG: phage head-tail connector protein [Clostridiaceae bacterium]